MEEKGVASAAEWKPPQFFVDGVEVSKQEFIRRRSVPIYQCGCFAPWDAEADMPMEADKAPDLCGSDGYPKGKPVSDLEGDAIQRGATYFRKLQRANRELAELRAEKAHWDWLCKMLKGDQ